MRCPACGTDNPPQATYCLECGVPLARRCAPCGAVLPESARFCMACGHPVVDTTPAATAATPPARSPAPPVSPRGYTPRHLAEKILANRDILAGERKHVTVLFADVVSSTELIRGRHAEDAQQILDGVVQVMMDAVHRYEGTVSRLMGDGLMAMFGAPVAHEDHAVRACNAALAMLEAASRHAGELRRTVGLTVAIRVGLSSGEVVVRTICDDLHMDYTAMGETLHLASRMEQLAEPGTAVLTAQVLALVEGYVQVRSLGLVPVKGLDRLVEVFRLLGAGLVRTRLQAAEFLYEASLYPELEYTFKHALTHEAAYGSLLQDRKRTLHEQVMTAIERLHADRLDEHVERLAHHALRAERWEQAARYSRLAAEKAMSRSANREAVAHYEQELTALGRLPESRDTRERGIDVRLDIRRALQPLDQPERTVEYLREAAAMAEVLGDRHRECRVYSDLGVSLAHLGTYDRAVEASRRARAAAGAIGDVPLQIVANGQSCEPLRSRGDYREDVELQRWVMAALQVGLARQRFGLAAYPAVTCRSNLAWSIGDLGGFDEALHLLEEAIRIAESLDHPYSIAHALTVLGQVHLGRGSYESAVDALERALTFCLAHDIRITLTWIDSGLGVAYAHTGRPPEGIARLERAMEQARTARRSQMDTVLALRRSEVLLADGRSDDASELAERALALTRRHNERGHEGWVLRQLGEIGARHGLPAIEPTESRYRAALARDEVLAMRPLQARCHLGLGKVLQRVGRLEEAQAELTTTVTMLREMEMLYWLPAAEAALAEASPGARPARPLR